MCQLFAEYDAHPRVAGPVLSPVDRLRFPSAVCLTARSSLAPGLGIAYGGTNREDVLSNLLPAMQDPKSNKEVRCSRAGARPIVPRPDMTRRLKPRLTGFGCHVVST